MYNCSVFQLKNFSLRLCHELAICTAMAAKTGDGSENNYTLEKTLLQVVLRSNLE
jgi:hypothetical protein